MEDVTAIRPGVRECHENREPRSIQRSAGDSGKATGPPCYNLDSPDGFTVEAILMISSVGEFIGLKEFRESAKFKLKRSEV
jgi:hypothetical protein